MNNQVKNLAIQAGFSETYGLQETERLNKLVELVVRECIDIIETAPTQHCAYTTHDKGTVDCAVGKAVAALHTHFELKTIYKA